MAKDFHSSGIIPSQTPYTGDGEANFSPELLQSMQFRQETNGVQQGLPDRPPLPMGTRDGIKNRMMSFHTTNDERTGYLPEWEISGNLPPAYPGLIQIDSEDDEVSHLSYPL